jgi:putative protein-disulfide isomerase
MRIPVARKMTAMHGRNAAVIDETRPHLIYFADPMCSWCWGFAPAMARIRDVYSDSLPIRLILGGLRPGTTEPMDEKAKDRMRGYWPRVAEASGQVLNPAFFEREGFVYDTDPAARAVVVMRERIPAEALAFFIDVQREFYQFNRDVTQIGTLAEIAEARGYPAADFGQRMASVEAREATSRDYAISRQTGVTGFPTLIAGTGQDNSYTLITQGFQPLPHVLALIASWRREAGIAA